MELKEFIIHIDKICRVKELTKEQVGIAMGYKKNTNFYNILYGRVKLRSSTIAKMYNAFPFLLNDFLGYNELDSEIFKSIPYMKDAELVISNVGVWLGLKEVADHKQLIEGCVYFMKTNSADATIIGEVESDSRVQFKFVDNQQTFAKSSILACYRVVAELKKR